MHNLSRLAVRLGAGAALATGSLAAPASAQTTSGRDVRSTADAWLSYAGEHPVSKHWGIHLEGQLRRADFAATPRQTMFRTGVIRQLANRVSATAGYLYSHDSPAGAFPRASATLEHRAWEQLALGQDAGPFALTHRFRLEQRWRQTLDGDGAVDGWGYTNRARYLIRSTIAPGGRAPGNHEPYLTGYNEVFVNFGDQVRLNVFDQNRAFIGAGYKWGRGLRAEAGYLNQLVLQADGVGVENNHTLLVGFFSDAPLFGGRH